MSVVLPLIMPPSHAAVTEAALVQRADEPSRPRGFGDGVGDEQVLQSVASGHQWLGVAANHRGEMLDLVASGSSRCNGTVRVVNGLYQERSSSFS